MTVPQLGSERLDGVLRVLEDCERAADLQSFRHIALEGMAQYLGYRHTTLVVGATLGLCFADHGAVVNGIAERLVEPYFESFPQHEVFAAPTVEHAVVYVVRRHGMVTYDQIRRLRFDHLTRHLGDILSKNGIGSHIVVKVRQSQTAAALMGVFDPEPGVFTPVDLQLTALVGRHLGNLIRWHTGETTGTLFSQQVTVTNLLARGFTIREIAGALDIGVDTVKKYLAQVMRVTGCRNRTQLALAWQQGFDQAMTRPAD